MTKLTHDDPDMVYCCPDCDKTRISKRSTEKQQLLSESDTLYCCWDCGAEFDELHQRKSRSGKNGMANREVHPSWPEFVKEIVRKERNE